MATSTKKNGKVDKNRIAEIQPADSGVKLPPMRRLEVTMKLIGISTLIQHQFGEKAKKMMRDKHAGKKSKNREIRDPEQEGRDAAYMTSKGEYGIPAMALKSAVLDAAHKDIGITKVSVSKSLFIKSTDTSGNIPMECDDPVIHEDTVRVGNNSTDLRYRPYFYNWSVIVTWEINTEWLTVDDLCGLVDRAGFGVGICEWRPEKGGDFGRFHLDSSFPLEVKEV